MQRQSRTQRKKKLQKGYTLFLPMKYSRATMRPKGAEEKRKCTEKGSRCRQSGADSRWQAVQPCLHLFLCIAYFSVHTFYGSMEGSEGVVRMDKRKSDTTRCAPHVFRTTASLAREKNAVFGAQLTNGATNKWSIHPNHMHKQQQ